MARRNAAFNRWAVTKVTEEVTRDIDRIVELGSGPGIGLQALSRAFPGARVWGIDRSPLMIAQARRRNVRAIQEGRLALIEGDTGALAGLAPIDLVLAIHVLYFWDDPAAELASIRGALHPGGWIALGYRLRKDMPRISQRQFPRAGHRLYDSDHEVALLLEKASFQDVSHALERRDGACGRLVVGKKPIRNRAQSGICR